MKDQERRLRQAGRTRAKLHDARLEAIAKKAGRPKENGHGEAEVVPGYQLSDVLRRWVVEYLAERPLDSQAMGAGDSGTVFMGPIDWLAEHTGINIRRVSGIVNGEFLTVPLSQADLLLQRANLGHLLGDEVQVVPNPNWSFEKWHAYQIERGGCDPR